MVGSGRTWDPTITQSIFTDRNYSAEVMRSEWFPFASQLELEVCLMCFGPNPLTVDKIEQLLATVSRLDPSAPSSVYLLRKVAERIPQARISQHTVEVVSSCVSGDEVKYYSSRQQIPVLSILDQIAIQLADPLRPDFYLDASTSSPVIAQFCQSEFAANPVLFSHLSSFQCKSEKFAIGDVVELQSGRVVRIESLHYDNEGALVVTSSCFWAASDIDLASVDSFDPDLGDLDRGELIHVPSELTECLSSQVRRHLAIHDGSNPDIPSESSKLCRSQLLFWKRGPDGGFVECSPDTSEVVELAKFMHCNVLFSRGIRVAGEKTLWIKVYIDSLEVQTSRPASMTAIYCSLLGMDARHQRLRENILVYAYAPHGAVLQEMIEPLLAELQLTSQGALPAGFYDVRRDEVMPAAVCLALCVADIPQACAIARHSGATTTGLCRSCWKRKASHAAGAETESQLADFSTPLSDASLRRRSAQMKSLAADLITRRRSDEVSKTAFEKERKALGLRLKDIVSTEDCSGPVREFDFFGAGFDSCMQCPYDPDHCLEYGVSHALLRQIHGAMTESAVAELDVRVRDFPFPRGFSTATFSFSNLISSRTSMMMVQKLTLVACFVLDGLCPMRHIQILAGLVRFKSQLLRLEQPRGASDLLRPAMQSLITNILSEWPDAMDTSVLHALEEMVETTLPIL